LRTCDYRGAKPDQEANPQHQEHQEHLELHLLKQPLLVK
jgi:hypothetical protein